MLPRLLSCCGAEARTAIAIHIDNVSMGITGGRAIPGGRRLASTSLVTERRGRILLPGGNARAQSLGGGRIRPPPASPRQPVHRGAKGPFPPAVTPAPPCKFSTLFITVTCTRAPELSSYLALLACRRDGCDVFIWYRKRFFHAEHTMAKTA